MYIPVWGYRNVEHYLCSMKKDSTQRTAVFRKSPNVAERNNAPKRVHEQVWTLQYSPATVKKQVTTQQRCVLEITIPGLTCMWTKHD
jgi:hypothetical protein